MNTSISLSGLWDFVVDLDPRYHTKPYYALPDWNRRHWSKVPVPGVWNLYDRRYDLFEGVGWFARELTLPPLPEGTTCLLRFGGVNYLCEVYLNGELAGTHEGGYTEFTVEVSHLVRSGRNVLAVRVDNRSLEMRLPPLLGYFNYGGIHRDVTLEVYPGAYLTDVGYEAYPEGEDGVLRLFGQAAKVEGGGYEVEVTCAGHTQREAVAPDGRFQLEWKVPGVTPWSPETPVLYPTRLTLQRGGQVEYQREFTVGFRRIAVRDRGVELNGKPLRFRGLCYVYDSPTYGLVMHPAQYETDLRLLQEMGANAIRSHFPLSEGFLHACDRAGILVWLEIPTYCIDTRLPHCRHAFTDPSLLQLALNMLEEMIRQARLHPSVCLYGIGNECDLNAPGAAEFFRQLATRARELDPTRLLSYACLYLFGVPDHLAELVDVVGLNEYWGWYDQVMDDDLPLETPPSSHPRTVDLRALQQLLDELATSCHKPVLLTEFGADSIPGYRSANRDFWSEDYHALLLRETLALADRYPFICGTFPFVFCDYRDPSKLVSAHWNGLNYKGVVTYERRKKLPFEAVREAYTQHKSGSSPPH